jgi:DNA-binding response OmpR family regulator
MRVLIVEDEERIASFLAKGLRRAGYGVEHTTTGADALAQLTDEETFGLVILDLGLPDIDGLDVLGEVRGRELTTPVIVITARTGDRDEALRRGADEFVAKPLSFRDLLGRVEELAGSGA